MKVKRLSMKAFRVIDQMTLEFDADGPTVLIGINGVGKSSILDCISILLSWFTGRIQTQSNSERPFKNEDITNKDRETHNEIDILYDFQKVTWSLTKARNGDTSSKLTELETFVEKIHSQLNDDSQLPVVIFYATNRVVLNIPLRIRTQHSFEPKDAYDGALESGEIDFRRFFEWFRNQEDIENENKLELLRQQENEKEIEYHIIKYRDVQLEAVRKAISSLRPEFSNLRVRRSPLRMTLEKEGEKLIVNQLSDGEKCLLATVGDLARRLAIANPGLSDPLEGKGVVLIDEIELHLHPKWQREIIPALTRTFPNCQFIVTTHSPQVVSHVKPQGIYILEKTDNGIVAKRPSSSFGRDSNRILEDLMDVPERPQDIKDRLLDLFRLIDKGDINGARELRQQLAKEIGTDEPEFVSADVLIRRREILNR
ncbi:MAG: AAA family ATPase [Hormoscilla sp. GUM202]|nr:AAA family ATPase [Hormoscilla sp. GUM202]